MFGPKIWLRDFLSEQDELLKKLQKLKDVIIIIKTAEKQKQNHLNRISSAQLKLFENEEDNEILHTSSTEKKYENQDETQVTES